jgi:hypothetical protein
MGHRSLQQKQNFSSTTVAVISGWFDPGLKALLIQSFFRGQKAPTPSEFCICDCSTSKPQLFAD